MPSLLNISGTYTHPANDLTERDVVTIDPSGVVQDTRSIIFDLGALLKNLTIRVKYSTDNGVTYTTMRSVLWTALTDPPIFQVPINHIGTGPFKITMQSALREIATRTIPYEYGYLA